jgi:hypothetical protein
MAIAGRSANVGPDPTDLPKNNEARMQQKNLNVTKRNKRNIGHKKTTFLS